LGIEVKTDDRLKEIFLGTWQGRPSHEVYKDEPIRGVYEKLGGGESYADVRKRVKECIDEIIEQHPGQKIIIVFHGGAMRSYLTHVLQMDLDCLHCFQISNTGIFRVLPLALRGDGKTGLLCSANDVNHLHIDFTTLVQHQQHQITNSPQTL